jgi:transcriptional regulator with XRE-family HTH domain
MPAQKLYAGAKLREVRTRIGLTQKDFAAKLGVSLPYLNQMENNNRPVSTGVVLGLAQEFGLDVTELGSGDTERLVSDMREAIADPVFTDSAPPLSDLRLAASNAPALARAFLDLHRAYRQTHERLASLDEALGQDGSATQSPWEEVRDFFHYCDNYIDAVDRAAERFAGQAEGDLVTHTEAVLARMGITLKKAPERGRTPLRSRDADPHALPPRRPGNPALSVPSSIRAPGSGPAAGGHARPRAIPDRHRPPDRAHRHGELLRRARS